MSWVNSEFTEDILSKLNLDRMMKDIAMFSRWERYSGSPQGEASVDYIVAQMKDSGVPVERLTYDIYRSLPVSGKLTILSAGGETFEAIPVVYSGEANELRGELVFDHLSLKKGLTAAENAERYASFRGKIVLTYDFEFDLYYEASRAGALGFVAIWPSDIHHHDTLGGVWGTPGKRDRDLYPFLPYVEIVKPQARVLLDLLKKGPVSIQMDVKMDNRIVSTSMPIATISGESDKFVLVSGHYDSWYEGMTDNGAANVLMMELARVLQQNRKSLKRTIVFAWWSGHSDGRYSGSTWYCDNHWKFLHDKCVAHINMDICGCRGSDAVRLGMSGMEGKRFNDDFLAGYNSRAPFPYRPLNRSADQTFWGTLIPVSISPKFYVDNEAFVPRENDVVLNASDAPASFGVEGPFTWWHTKEDSLDKVSAEVLLRDCRIAAQLTCRYSNEDPLPVDLLGFMAEMKGYFAEFATKLTADFDVAPLLPLIDKLDEKIRTLAGALNKKSDTDDIIIKVAGELARLKFTCSSPYYHDRAVPHPPYAAFTEAIGLTKETTREDDWLFIRTDFVRQRNRMVGELCRLMDDIDYQLLRWQVDEGRKK